MTRAGEPRPPGSIDEALGRSARHARNAVAESLLAAHALLDAVSIGLVGRPASAEPDHEGVAHPLARLSRRVESLAAMVRADEAGLPDVLVRAILEALEVEIDRWESRARDDREARAVLRAFLGLREILWELGVRDGGGARERRDDDPTHAAPDEEPSASPGGPGPGRAPEPSSSGRSSDRSSDRSSGRSSDRSAGRRGRARVQRIDVEG
jgi:hypothetical protein